MNGEKPGAKKGSFQKFLRSHNGVWKKTGRKRNRLACQQAMPLEKVLQAANAPKF